MILTGTLAMHPVVTLDTEHILALHTDILSFPLITLVTERRCGQPERGGKVVRNRLRRGRDLLNFHFKILFQNRLLPDTVLHPLPISMSVLKTVVAEEVYAVLTTDKSAPMLTLRAHTLFNENGRVVDSMACTMRRNEAIVTENVVARCAGDVRKSGFALDTIKEPGRGDLPQEFYPIQFQMDD